MKLIAGSAVSAMLVLAVAAAQAQTVPPSYRAGGQPYAPASDFESPYAEPPPGYGYGDASFLPPHEIFEVLRESGFSPIGVPRLRGFVYVITAFDRRGADGRLVIDARTGQILNFTPVDRMGGNDEPDMRYGSNGGPYGWHGALPPSPAPMAALPAGPRPPAPIPHIASRTTPGQAQPLPVPRPAAAGAARAEPAPQPQQQSAAAVAPKPAPVTAAAVPPPAPPAAATTVGQAKPAQQILPTQPMPQAQGLEY